MDNRVFNVNGSGKETLEKTIELAFIQSRGCYLDHNSQELKQMQARGWKYTEDLGLILLWDLTETKDAYPFLTPYDAKLSASIVWDWLQNSETWSKTKLDGSDIDYDGSNSKGWRVYCDQWGHVGDCRYSIIAIKPAWMWLGK